MTPIYLLRLYSQKFIININQKFLASDGKMLYFLVEDKQNYIFLSHSSSYEFVL